VITADLLDLARARRDEEFVRLMLSPSPPGSIRHVLHDDTVLLVGSSSWPRDDSR